MGIKKEMIEQLRSTETESKREKLERISSSNPSHLGRQGNKDRTTRQV
jgi:hypothetical protein